MSPPLAPAARPDAHSRSVELNKAVQQEACEMYADAIKTYSDIVKNKNYAAANRLRVNMGNIYFKQKPPRYLNRALTAPNRAP